jgi:tRNA (guanine37-N1)-methyltransferase
VIIDAVSRHVNGVLGNSASTETESHQEGCLEYPQYTRPFSFEDMAAPEVLVSGNHQQIKAWRRKESLRRTFLRRPDMFGKIEFKVSDYPLLEELAQEIAELAELRDRWKGLRPKKKRVIRHDSRNNEL